MICTSCANEFLQPFVCMTCGAQKLHDHTLKALEKENAELREELAQTRKDARRYQHVRKNPAMLLHLSNKGFDEAIDNAIEQLKDKNHG